MQYTDAAPFDCNSSTREILRFNKSDENVSLGEVFLNPTRIYCDPVVDLIKFAQSNESGFSVQDLRGICHVTGGGLSNLLRPHDSLGWEISNPRTPHPEFTWLAEWWSGYLGNVSDIQHGVWHDSCSQSSTR